MNPRALPHGLSSLVALKGTNQLPMDLQGSAVEFRGFLDQRLNATLTQAGRKGAVLHGMDDGLGFDARRMLGDHDQARDIAVSSGLGEDRIDPLKDGLQAVFQSQDEGIHSLVVVSTWAWLWGIAKNAFLCG